MIHLHTGLPGAGKTLCTLVEVKKRAEAEKRGVYYSGIADLKLPWTELDKGEDWHTVPDGSIVVIDEAQRCFRPRHTSSAVPVHVEKLETHRHRGIDLYVVTQHPKLLDSNVRRLVGRHVHFVRAFGANAVTRHEWGEVKDDPQSRDDSIRSLVPYPVDAFSWYHSAEVHTHKRRLPRAVWMLAVLPVLVGSLGFVAWRSLPWGTDATKIPQAVKPEQLVQEVRARRQEAKGVPVSVKDSTAWLAERQPRIRGLAYSAPVYDSVTQPVTAPYPAACVASSSRCHCYSQQGTRLEVPEALCRQFVASGFFKDWADRPAEGRQERSRTAQEQAQEVAPMDIGPGPVSHLRGPGIR